MDPEIGEAGFEPAAPCSQSMCAGPAALLPVRECSITPPFKIANEERANRMPCQSEYRRSILP